MGINAIKVKKKITVGNSAIKKLNAIADERIFVENRVK
jgi:hypothetical protein